MIFWRKLTSLIFMNLVMALFMVGCGAKMTPTPTDVQATLPSDNLTSEPSLTPTIEPTVTQTAEPLAALVNGQGITVEEYQQELARFRQAKTDSVGTNLATESLSDEMIVLNDLIDLVLLAQGAEEENYIVDDIALESRFNQLAEQVDLPAWLQAQGYKEAYFRIALRRSIQAAWMRDQIMARVPAAVEQIHARQILLYNSDEANQVYANLQSGADFLGLAKLYDPAAAGDLGWFPRGYLTELSVEQAAFELTPGDYSSVIETHLGFHIVQVIERDPERSLGSDVRLELQIKAVKDWLAARKEVSEIQLMLP